MATSILFSAFESWLINEHQRVSNTNATRTRTCTLNCLQRNYEPESLGVIFANAYFGNSLVAIISGIVAQLVANSFGYV